jgi:hypothetical protein
MNVDPGGARLPNGRDALNRPRTRRRPRPRFVSAAVAMIARSTTSESGRKTVATG